MKIMHWSVPCAGGCGNKLTLTDFEVNSPGDIEVEVELHGWEPKQQGWCCPECQDDHPPSKASQ